MEEKGNSRGETGHSVERELFVLMVQKCQQNGIVIPFPERDLHVRSPLSDSYSHWNLVPVIT
jgi:small-conductance mechanosensitive channel